MVIKFNPPQTQEEAQAIIFYALHHALRDIANVVDYHGEIEVQWSRIDGAGQDVDDVTLVMMNSCEEVVFHSFRDKIAAEIERRWPKNEDGDDDRPDTSEPGSEPEPDGPNRFSLN
jgi:hypothetical protein